ncbi:NAD(P)-binding protein [Peniophora sp. CONT]|nr:NAD(P)-binding protein [Peniophora sp. CONT]
MTGAGKVWFITGASSNFGIALTRSLLDAGYRVVATARTVSKVPFESHASLLILPLDVNDAISISHAFDEAMKKFGRIDVVVNKAGIHACGELESIPEAAAREMFDVQFWGPAYIQAMATSIFEAQGDEGLIINVSSALAVFNAPLRTMISATKAAAEALTLARSRSSPFVTALNVRPGAFERNPRTDFYPQLSAYASKDLGRTIAGSMRKQGAPPPGIGDVDRMAASLIALAELPGAQRPGVVSLGSDAYAMARVCAKKRVDHLREGQRLLKAISSSSSHVKAEQVWFVTNASSSFGQTLVRVLLARGERVAAVIAAQQSSVFTAQDTLLLLQQESASTSATIATIDATIERFGRIDVVVNAPLDTLSLGENESEASRALLERVFWEPVNACTAAVKTFRERNPPGAGGRIFNVLTTADSNTKHSDLHTAANSALNAVTTSLVRELPGKWRITAAALTIDSDLLANEQTAQLLLSLANVSNSALPSQLPIGARALASAQHAADIELSAALSNDAMTRALKTDHGHIDGRARVGLTEAIFTLVLSPSPSFMGWISSVISILGWGLRLVVSEKIVRRGMGKSFESGVRGS